MSEEELTRRSADFRKDSRKNKYTHKANDEFKKEKNKDIIMDINIMKFCFINIINFTLPCTSNILTVYVLEYFFK